MVKSKDEKPLNTLLKNQMRYFDNTLLEIPKKYQENAMMISNRCNPIKKNIEA
jgi:hypothetical protein